MNHNTEKINRYLQNEMDGNEKTAFEAALVTNEDLKNELYAQQQVLKAVMHAGIKSEFAKAIRHKLIVKRWITWGSLAAACIIAILIVTSRMGIFSSANPLNIQQEVLNQVAVISRPFIDPPMPGANVPLQIYHFDAEKGDRIVYPSGSVIYFPPSALVDKDGKPVTGKVTITYREFADPLDFFVSGIPMSYDSAGKKYNFESAAMCEINAYKDNHAVFVNPKAKPEVNLSCLNKSRAQNLYFLDTVKRNWEFIGKDIITVVKDLAPGKKPATQGIINVESNFLLPKPVKPLKASEDKQSFSIEIEPESFEELQSYNGLKFEVVDESTYRRSDADEHWDNVKLNHTDVDGVYGLSFSRTGRTVTYKVRPVLEGSDYDAALKVFEEKNKAYETTLKNRLAREKLFADSIDLFNQKRMEDAQADYAWNEKMNQLIRERNKRLRELKRIQMDEQQKAMEAEQQRGNDQNLQLNRQLARSLNDEYLTSEVIRTFPVNSFGVWNCDQPVLPQGAIPITAAFTDSANNNIGLVKIMLVNEGFNGIIQQLIENKKIVVMPNNKNMLWGIRDSSFYYFTYDDFTTAGITVNTRSYTFKMRRSEKEISSYNELRVLVGKL